ncbi:MAG: efflux RND transporter periplasmic adaptor subunit [Bacteroidales bacterium]
MNLPENKVLKLTLIAVVVLVAFVIIGKKLGWIVTEKPVEVYAETVARRTIYETITASGRIEPVVNVKVSADVSGEIIELLVKEGQRVEAGQLLLKIKPNTYISVRDRAKAALDNARVNLDNAQARYQQAMLQLDRVRQNYERNKKLWENKLISQSEWEAAESEYKLAEVDLKVAAENVRAAEYGVKSAEASLAEAQENLMKTTVYAPLAGIVTRLNVKRGERVVGTEMMAGTELLQIADLTKMQVVVSVNENDIVRVKPGDTALVEVDAYMGKKFRGIVTDISHSANVSGQLADQVTTFEVKIELLPESYASLIMPNNPYPLRPGMTANVEIHTQVSYNAISVPLAALTVRSSNSDTVNSSANSDRLKDVVFVYDRGRARMRMVTTGIQDENYVEIKMGVETGEKVIVGPYNMISRQLKDSMLVKVVDQKKIIKQ